MEIEGNEGNPLDGPDGSDKDVVAEGPEPESEPESVGAADGAAVVERLEGAEGAAMGPEGAAEGEGAEEIGRPVGTVGLEKGREMLGMLLGRPLGRLKG